MPLALQCRRATAAAAFATLVSAALPATWNPGADASPWDDPRWRDSSRTMQLYICGSPDTRAEWCGDLADYRLAYHIVEYDEPFGPPMPPELARWYALIERGNLQTASPADIRLIRKRAEAEADPLAMETLGYLYFNGIGLGRDLARSYIWYARAVLAGQREAAANRDLVWALLVRENPVAARRLVKRFSAPAESNPTTVSSASGDRSSSGSESAESGTGPVQGAERR